MSTRTTSPVTMDAPLSLRLRAGDVLLYRPSSLFGWGIRLHTGGPQSHVEVYMGAGRSLASRDKQGVGIYPLRETSLGWVLRPTGTFSVDGALDWYEREGRGQKYGWIDLFQFFGFSVNGPGMVCSPCAVYVLRAGGIPVFGTVPAERIAPNDFPLSELLRDVTTEALTVSVRAGGRGHVPAPTAA